MERDEEQLIRRAQSGDLTAFDLLVQQYDKPVLQHSAVRIEAIDALSQARDDEDVLPILQRAARDDTSAYVQYKASKALGRRENPTIGEKGRQN